jgi:hypothetical protein
MLGSVYAPSMGWSGSAGSKYWALDSPDVDLTNTAAVNWAASWKLVATCMTLHADGGEGFPKYNHERCVVWVL